MGQATAIHSHGRSAFARAGAALLAALRAYANATSYARDMYRQYLALSAMNDAALRAIGLQRADIPAVVTGTYRARFQRMAPVAFDRASVLQDRRRAPRRSVRRS